MANSKLSRQALVASLNLCGHRWWVGGFAPPRVRPLSSTSPQTRPFSLAAPQTRPLSTRQQTSSHSAVVGSQLGGSAGEAQQLAMLYCPELTKAECRVDFRQPAEQARSEDCPVVLLLGWAGASHRNLSKYAELYLELGLPTAQFILSTRHIFRDSHQVPELMDRLAEQLGERGLLSRPLFIHCLSDTGVMCYQGLSLVRPSLKVRGVVWDSCPGPYPEVTPARVFAFLMVNWLCSSKDGLGLAGGLHSSYRLLLDRAWPNLLRKWKGLPVDLNLINGVWCGHFGRDHYKAFPHIPELFLYSNKDFYLSKSYLERKVISLRSERASSTAVLFPGSAHVAHLRKHKKAYKNQVTKFVKANM